MARQVTWSKRRNEYAWTTKVGKVFNLGDKKIQLVVHAGRYHSSVLNKNAVLEVNISDGTPRGFKNLVTKEFKSAWQAKDFVDCVLTILWQLAMTEEQSLNWLIDTVSKVPFILPDPPSNSPYATIEGRAW